MDLNLEKTWEIVLKGNSLRPLLDPLQFTEHKEWLKGEPIPIFFSYYPN